MLSETSADQFRFPDLRVEEYDRAKHLALMTSWYVGWGYEPIVEEHLPSIGFVVGNCVMQFLVLTDCGVVFYDCFISDPKSDPETRKRAIEVAHELCAMKARSLGYKRVVTFVSRQHVLDTAMKSFKANDSEPRVTQGWLLEGGL